MVRLGTKDKLHVLMLPSLKAKGFLTSQHLQQRLVHKVYLYVLVATRVKKQVF